MISRFKTTLVRFLILGCWVAIDGAAAESLGGKTPARAARSVHLQWSGVEGAAFYIEVTVERSARGTYVAAAGWSGGYFGLQELGDGKKVAIFSVWDPTKGDDPNAVTPEQRVELLYEGEGVRIKRFGGEGTGGQCMVDFPWVAGVPVRFLVRAEAHEAVGVVGGKTAYSGWIFDGQRNGWRQLVTFRTRNAGKLLRGLYSFVEDFRRDTRSADDVRRACLDNVWTQPAAGEWQAVKVAKFTASRADWEARDTINAGVSPTGFFLVTGGETSRMAELGAMLSWDGGPGVPPRDLPAAVFVSSAAAVPK